MLSGIKFKSKTQKPKKELSELLVNEKFSQPSDYDKHFFKHFKTETEEEFSYQNSDYKPQNIDKYKHPFSQTSNNCTKCIGSNKFKEHLLVKTEDNFYLSVPENPLTEGHALIVPNSHVLALTELEPDEFFEFTALQKHLVSMYKKHLGKSLVFVEAPKDLSLCKHTAVEVVPITPTQEEDCRIMVYKELTDSDEEWTSNPRVIQTTNKPIPKAVPQGFGYIHFDFNAKGGYAHVVEDKRHFRGDLARQILAEVLGVDPLFRRRGVDSSINLLKSFLN